MDTRTVIAEKADLLAVPEGFCEEHEVMGVTSELLFGETVVLDPATVANAAAGYLRVRSVHDDYSGQIKRTALSDSYRPSSHIVIVPTTIAYSEPKSSAVPLMRLSMGSRVQVVAERDRWSGCSSDFWVPSCHLRPISDLTNSMDALLEYASSMVGVPYRWGGRSSSGLDCSGLVQICFLMIGVQVPRDSKDQRRMIGNKISWEQGSVEQLRGDLFFLDGHVGVVNGDGTCIHASGYWMRVIREAFSSIEERAISQGQARLQFSRWAPES